MPEIAVNRRQQMALALYVGQGSPYAWRAFLAIEHKRLPYELKVLSFSNGETRTPEFIALNPRHQVPTLVDGDFVVWESAVVMEYLEEAYPAKDAATSLFPGDAKQRALIRRLAREADDYLWAEGLLPIAMEILFGGADHAPDEARIAAAKIALAKELDYFAAQMRGSFLAGDTPTAADFTLYPFLGYIARLELKKPGLAIQALIPQKIRDLMGRIEALPFFDKTFPPHWRT
jgi:glutathione S-transferase